MSNQILITYASRTGATAGVAEAIGATLAEAGVQVDVLPVQNVGDLAAYDAVVVGSAIQNKQWLPEAMQFVQARRTTLSRRPVAIFLVCMTLAMPNGEKYRQDVSGWLQPVRALLRPVSEGLFAGTLDINKIPSFGDRMKFRASVALGAWSEGDHRDWEAIHAWATDLQFHLLSPTAGRTLAA